MRVRARAKWPFAIRMDSLLPVLSKAEASRSAFSAGRDAAEPSGDVMKPLAPFLFVLAVTIEAHADVKVEENSSFYPLQGLTSREIHRDLMRSGPRDDGGKIIEGEVGDHLTVDFRSRMDGNVCRAFNERVTLKLKIQLPKWVDEGRAAPDVRASWKQYMDKLLAHENRHKEIAISTAQTAHDIVHMASASGSCKGFSAKVHRTVKRAIADAEEKQEAWDKNAAPFGIE